MIGASGAPGWRCVLPSRRLILSKSYDGFTAADIAEEANVGRSTFYEHHRGKEDMLAQSVTPVLTPFADLLADEDLAPVC